MLHVRVENELAKAMGDDERAPYAASMLYGLLRTLQVRNTTRIYRGQSAEEVSPEAVADAEKGFALLEQGLGDCLA